MLRYTWVGWAVHRSRLSACLAVEVWIMRFHLHMILARLRWVAEESQARFGTEGSVSFPTTLCLVVPKVWSYFVVWIFAATDVIAVYNFVFWNVCAWILQIGSRIVVFKWSALVRRLRGMGCVETLLTSVGGCIFYSIFCVT